MKIYVFPADMTGCGMYRLVWPAQALQAAGHDVEIVESAQEFLKAEIQGYRVHKPSGKMEGGKAIRVHIPADADVIVLQRPTHRYLADAVPLIRAQGVAVVVEMDDDLSSIHPNHPARHAFDPLYSAQHNWTHVERACAEATLVVATTQPLLDKYARGHGILIPNFVPQAMLDIAHADSARIGWGGSVASHPGDPGAIGDALARLLKAGQRLTVVGPGPIGQVAGEFGLRSRQVELTGPVDVAGWGHALAANIGVGVAPLRDNAFNRAKSFLKVLEYSAVGIPYVASGLPEYRSFHADAGGGLIVESPNQWFRTLQKLVKSRTLRMDLAAAGRAAVRERFTVEGNAWRWAEAWRLAYAVENGAVGVAAGSRASLGVLDHEVVCTNPAMTLRHEAAGSA